MNVKRVRILLLAVMMLMTLVLSSCTVHVDISITPWGEEGSASSPEAAPTPIPTATSAPTAVMPSALVLREEMEYQAVSASPDGSVELCVKDGMLYIRCDGQVIPVTMNESRGVPDTYGRLAELYGLGARAIGNEGVTWSPDGRYITLNNYRFSATRYVGSYNPMLLDTVTGEMYLAATYNDDVLNASESWIPFSSVFSRDGKYLYVAMAGMAPTRVVRIDLQTLAQETLITCTYNLSGPSLCETADGRLLFGGTDFRESTPEVLISLSEVQRGWIWTSHDFAIPSADLRWSKLLYSKAHDAVVAYGGGGTLFDISLLQFVRCSDESFGDLDVAWWIPSIDAQKAEKVAISDMDYEKRSSMDGINIMDMTLSPDGEYALLICREKSLESYGEMALLALRLEDMTLTRISGVDEITLYNCSVWSEYSGISWFGNTVLFVDMNGASHVYTIVE